MAAGAGSPGPAGEQDLPAHETASRVGQSAAGAKLESLQVLRGIAAAMVVLYHTGTLYAVNVGDVLWGNVFRAGFAGVEVFFVLSGLVIYWVHAGDIGQPQRARSFLIRRGFRLLPVYWVVVALKALKDHAVVSAPMLLTAVFLLPAYPPFINVSWTLTYELFFYALFLLWIVLPKGWWSVLPIALLVLPAVTPAPAVAAGSVLQDLVRFLFNQHLLAFAFGVGVGWAIKRFGAAGHRSALAMIAIGLAAFLAAAAAGTVLVNQAAGVSAATAYEFAELRSNAVFDAGVWTFALPAALLIAGLLSLELRGRLRIPLRRPLGWLGDVSYSLYLTHGFVIHLGLRQPDVRSVIETAPIALVVLWGAVLLVAWLFYRAIEVPALRLGQRLASRRS